MSVAPFAGAWIEIEHNSQRKPACIVAPFAGAWIEMQVPCRYRTLRGVAPFAGAWIEMKKGEPVIVSIKSLPSRERGLKLSRKCGRLSRQKSLPSRERGLK